MNDGQKTEVGGFTSEPNIVIDEGGAIDAVEDEQEVPLWKECVDLLVRAGFWAFLIYLLIFQVSEVDGLSMHPGFEHKDRVVVDKLTYHFSGVKRFDVIVFETIDTESHPRMPRDYIKRVIGLPGELVEIHNRQLWINNKLVEENFGPEPYKDSREIGSKGVSFIVPPMHFFVMGDNRGDSRDSRKDFRGGTLGFVPRGQIKGLVRMRISWKRFAWFGHGE